MTAWYSHKRTLGFQFSRPRLRFALLTMNVLASCTTFHNYFSVPEVVHTMLQRATYVKHPIK